jgi:hypothetical protein
MFSEIERAAKKKIIQFFLENPNILCWAIVISSIIIELESGFLAALQLFVNNK